ncbi:hypothetical protein L2E82_44517 [Cichorium intybus]|uniref:Uncharacterized protein n=1 Tax=Cichorium intybus TaxID=13427 RepID=A0ACB8ZUW9_CICIN|nr:hypothetical protein L2E82_44517 [Cichorium intybus]
MGACVSIHHKASTMKAQKSFDSTKKPDHKVAIHHPPPTNEKFPVMNGHVAVKPQLPPSQSPAPISDFGSKEETFFDTQGWLDSDYEDDFMSVNGEFTPSRGNTPVHHSLTLPTKQVQTDADTGTEPIGFTREPSPIPSDKKMRLLDLFKESVREDDHIDNEETIEPPKNDGLKSKSERPVGSLHGCFSNLLYVRGSGRQKKKSLNSSASVGRNAVVG